jgi:hypothetical protein
VKKTKKKRLEVDDNQKYNAIESPSAEPEQQIEQKPKTKAKRLKSSGKSKKSVEVCLFLDFSCAFCRVGN